MLGGMGIDVLHIKAAEKPRENTTTTHTRKLIKLPTDEKKEKSEFLAWDQKFLRHFSRFSQSRSFYWAYEGRGV